MMLIAVALGGALGAVLRYLAVLAAARAFGTGFPFGVLAVNVGGSLAMGVLAALLVEPAVRAAPAAAPFLMTGVLGGFTTYSAFALDAVALIERGRLDLAALYVGGTTGLALGGLALGLAVGRALIGAAAS